MKHLLFGLVAAVCVIPFSTGCHTVQGAGEDIQRAGEKSQETIDPGGQRPSDNMDRAH